MKRLQNKVAESRHTLPVALLYGTGVWLAAGLIQQAWWIQFACFALSVLLMVELNNKNLLIRIYSRAVSVTYILLFCSAVFLFPSWHNGFVQICVISSLLFLYACYQDTTTVGLTYYTFLMLGIGSIANPFLLFYLPIYWLMMVMIVYSFSLRTFFASLLGLLTPYWFLAGWIVYQDSGDLSAIIRHFSCLTEFQSPFDFQSVSRSCLYTIILTVSLWLIGIIHFIHTSYLDKIRVRQLYYSFIIIGIWSILLFVLQPRQEELTLGMLMITASPFFGHYVSLTHSKFTNITVWVLTVIILLTTVFNLWTSLSPS